MSSRTLHMPDSWARAGDLTGFVAAMPGGAALVAELSRPPSGLTVVTCVAERVPLTYVEDAFPVHDAGRTPTARNLVLAVPDVVTDVLAWYGADDEYYVDRVPVPPGPVDALARLAARVWRDDPEVPLDEVAGLLEPVLDALCGHPDPARFAHCCAVLLESHPRPALGLDAVTAAAAALTGR